MTDSDRLSVLSGHVNPSILRSTAAMSRRAEQLSGRCVPRYPASRVAKSMEGGLALGGLDSQVLVNHGDLCIRLCMHIPKVGT